MPECGTRTNCRNAFTKVMTRGGAESSAVSMSAERWKKTSCLRSSSKTKNLQVRLSLSSEDQEGRAKRSLSSALPLKRLTASDALVLWFEENGALRPQAFIELYELTKRPIYLFVNQMALHLDKLHVLLKVAASKSLPLIVVGAERDADWSTYGGSLEEDFSPKFLRVGRIFLQMRSRGCSTCSTAMTALAF